MQSDIAKHPWFFYIGGASQMDSSNKNLNGALSARLGFFLLLNKLDLAVVCHRNNCRVTWKMKVLQCRPV